MALTLVLTSSETMSLRLRLLAEGEGSEARTVSNAADALAQAGAARLLVVDERPPGMRLEELLRQWRRRNDAASVLLLGSREAPSGVLTAAPGQWDEIRRALVQGLRNAPAPAGPDEQDEGGAFTAALGRASILVVDDSVTFREYLRGELAREGASVHCTGKADEALRMIEGGAFDCVMIDLVMPGLDGAVLCRRLAALRRERGLLFYIVVMSSREAEADLVRSLMAGADDFFGKSQNLSVLKAKLSAILRRKFMIDTLTGSIRNNRPLPE